MALTQRLQIRQSQALVMTPQLMQAIKLLQLSNLDLVAYVEGELERNPLLERAAEVPAATGEAPAADGAAGDGADWSAHAADDGGAAERQRTAAELEDAPPAGADAADP